MEKKYPGAAAVLYDASAALSRGKFGKPRSVGATFESAGAQIASDGVVTGKTVGPLGATCASAGAQIAPGGAVTGKTIGPLGATCASAGAQIAPTGQTTAANQTTATATADRQTTTATATALTDHLAVGPGSYGLVAR